MSANKFYILSRTSIYFFLGFLFLIKPTCLPYIFGGILNDFYMIISFSICAVVFFLYITKRKKCKVVIWVAIYYLYQILVTVVNDGDVRSIVITALQFISICMFTEIGIKADKTKLINILSFVLEIYVYINFATIIMFPDGLYLTVSTGNPNNWFLGYKNQMINYILPALALVLLNYYYNTDQKTILRKIRVLLLYTCCILTSIIMWSGATMIISFIMIAFILFRKVLTSRIFNFRNYLFVNIALTFSVVVLRLQNLFSYIIVDILKKDITLTGRIYIWDKAIQYVSENFIFGYGVEYFSDRVIKMQMGNSAWLTNYAALHSHCRYLEVLYRGGLILLAIYMVILFITSGKLMQFKDTIYSKIISISLFSYLTGMITEWYDYSPMFFVLMVMAFYSDRYEENNKLQELKGGT